MCEDVCMDICVYHVCGCACVRNKDKKEIKQKRWGDKGREKKRENGGGGEIEEGRALTRA